MVPVCHAAREKSNGDASRRRTKTRSHPLDGDGFRWKVDRQPVLPQHACADQDFIPVDKRCLRSNPTAVEGKINEIDVFVDSLIGCQERRYPHSKPRVYTQSKLFGQFQLSVETRVNDSPPATVIDEDVD